MGCKTEKRSQEKPGRSLLGETLRATDKNSADRGKRKDTPRRRVNLSGPYLMLGIVALGMLSGCESSSFVPSRPPELVGSSTDAAKASGAAPSPASSPAGATTVASAGAKPSAIPHARVRLVELLLARSADPDRSYVEQVLRRDTGAKKCAFRVVSPKEGEPMSPEQLASEIRTAANRSTGALILEPIDDPEVREALRGGIEGPGSCPARFAFGSKVTRQVLSVRDVQWV